MKRNKVLKILAAILAVVLISGILLITNAFVGNPISAKIAQRAVKNYVREKYSFLDLELEKPVYNFKDGSYVTWAKSKTSIDTKFSINYRDGEVYYDSYEFDVLDMHNTLRRLEDEYTLVVRKILEEELAYKDNATRVMYDKSEYEGAKNILKLAMGFDRSLPLNSRVSISIKNVENVSLENISEILAEVHWVFMDNECYFQEYGLYIGDSDTVVTIYGVTPENIESGQLLDLLQQAKDYRDDIVLEKNGDKMDDGRGITVFIKTK